MPKPEFDGGVADHHSVMSPNATLLAYTGPSNIKELRDQAALISILWRDAEQENKKKNPGSESSDHTSGATLKPGSLETLTIESEKSNIIVRALQPRLLLVLVGGRPPKRDDGYFKVTPEAVGDARYPPADYTSSPLEKTSSSSSADNTANEDSPQEQDGTTNTTRNEMVTPLDADLQLGLLHIQRKKIDAATEHMRADFRSKGFTMPHDLSIP